MKNKKKKCLNTYQAYSIRIQYNKHNDRPQIQTKYTYNTKNTKNYQIISLKYYFAFFFRFVISIFFEMTNDPQPSNLRYDSYFYVIFLNISIHSLLPDIHLLIIYLLLLLLYEFKKRLILKT